VRLTTGTLDYGQGHATPFAQVLSAQLGVPFDKITLEQNDSDLVRFGNGTGGSRSITATGAAIVEVFGAGNRKGQAGRGLSDGSPPKATSNSQTAASPSPAPIARSASWDLAQRMREGTMPEGAPTSLDVDHATKDTPSTFPNGCQSRKSRSILETGVVRIVHYTGVSDFGTIVNPMIVEGQLHGGVAQGIGQALMEQVSYDASGPADHRLIHGLRAAASGGHSADGQWATIPRRQSPIRWAPKAAARPAVPEASFASSMR